MTFQEWLKEVDRVLIRNSGLSRNDLPDWDYWEAYECEISPEQTAFDLLETEGLLNDPLEEYGINGN